MGSKIIREAGDKAGLGQVLVHNQCVIHDILMGLFDAVDKAGLGFVYGGAVVEAQKKFEEYNDSVRLKKERPEKPKKEEKEDPNKSLIKREAVLKIIQNEPERHSEEDDTLTPL